MKYAPSTANIDSRLFRILLTPSWLSGIVDVVFSLALSLGTILMSNYQTSSIRLDFLDYQAGHITYTYQRVGNALSANAFIGNLPLLIFWSLVGLVVYLFVSNIFAAINNTAELKDELDYVHVDRKELIWTAVMHLGLRIAILGVWIVYILFFIHHLLPYCIAASLAASSHFSSLQNAVYITLAVVVMTIGLHINTVLLRLLLFRPRVFTDALYVD